MWARVWQRCKKWLVKKLVDDPHSTILHGGLSGTSVQLKFDTKIDGRLFIETEIVHRIPRLIAQVVFRTPSGEWTEPWDGLIDTGSSVSVIPHSVWQNIAYRSLAEGTEMNIGGLTVSGQLALVTLRLRDEQTVSPPLRVKANLIEEEGIPLILGFEDVLTELLLVSDYRNDRAYVLFHH